MRQHIGSSPGLRKHQTKSPKRLRRLRRILTVLMAATALGCREDAQSPTDPESDPAPSLATSSMPLSFRMVSAGTSHTCGLTADSLAYCWGGNGAGQLGDGTHTERLTPVRVAGGLRFVQISAGGAHTCAVTKNNLAYCWGKNSWGQLGDGTQ